jgi:cold shock CspA family protein/ribosome-associated translation inhibitor RaiA
MQIPAEIDFQGLEATPDIRVAIEAHLDKLEHRYGRITAGRVVLKGPGAHHRAGGLYEVNISLTLPDKRMVNVGKTATLDERHADLEFAINDAFKRARRRLQDHARRMQGQVKQHEEQPTGFVARLDPSGEFGFLATADGREIYFHRNSVLDDGFARLEPGSHVAFAEEAGDKGPQASTVRLIGKHGMRA